MIREQHITADQIDRLARRRVLADWCLTAFTVVLLLTTIIVIATSIPRAIDQEVAARVHAVRNLHGGE